MTSNMANENFLPFHITTSLFALRRRSGLFPSGAIVVGQKLPTLFPTASCGFRGGTIRGMTFVRRGAREDQEVFSFGTPRQKECRFGCVWRAWSLTFDVVTCFRNRPGVLQQALHSILSSFYVNHPCKGPTKPSSQTSPPRECNTMV